MPLTLALDSEYSRCAYQPPSGGTLVRAPKPGHQRGWLGTRILSYHHCRRPTMQIRALGLRNMKWTTKKSLGLLRCAVVQA